MTTLSETLLPYSIEDFVTEGEAERILSAVDRYKTEHPERLAAGAKGITVHSSSVMNVDELVAMYQPQGRLDINTVDLPFEVIDIIEQAFFRHIEDIRRAYPSATWPYAV